MNRPLTIHIGLPKTGSTALQMNLFVTHPELAYIGKPLTRFSNEQASVFQALMCRPEDEWKRRLPEYRASLEEMISGKPGAAVLLSEEELSTARLGGRVGRKKVAERLYGLFPNAHILVVVRNQLHAMQSLYCQLSRVGLIDVPTFQGWIEPLCNRPELLDAYDYGAVVEDYEALFGPHQVQVLAFEHLNQDRESFIREVCKICVVDPDVGLKNYRDVRRNHRISAREHAWNLARHSVPGLPAIHAIPDENARSWISDFLSEGPPVDTSIPPQVEASLSAFYAPGNRSLQKRTDLPLQQLGYPY